MNNGPIHVVQPSRLTCMGLPNLSQIVWVYMVALTLRGFRHLISPRWVEEM